MCLSLLIFSLYITYANTDIQCTEINKDNSLHIHIYFIAFYRAIVFGSREVANWSVGISAPELLLLSTSDSSVQLKRIIGGWKCLLLFSVTLLSIKYFLCIFFILFLQESKVLMKAINFIFIFIFLFIYLLLLISPTTVRGGKKGSGLCNASTSPLKHTSWKYVLEEHRPDVMLFHWGFNEWITRSSTHCAVFGIILGASHGSKCKQQALAVELQSLPLALSDWFPHLDVTSTSFKPSWPKIIAFTSNNLKAASCFMPHSSE